MKKFMYLMLVAFIAAACTTTPTTTTEEKKDSVEVVVNDSLLVNDSIPADTVSIDSVNIAE